VLERKSKGRRMSALRILIGGREYQVACDDGEEGRLKNLAKLLDERVRLLGGGSGKVSDTQAMMLAGLMLTDELEDAKRELTSLRSDIQNSSHSFETNKQIELESAIATTIHDIASRVEAIAGELEQSY
jgi:cell division protein ZapA